MIATFLYIVKYGNEANLYRRLSQMVVTFKSMQLENPRPNA
jgi:hypothetical protein